MKLRSLAMAILIAAALSLLIAGAIAPGRDGPLRLRVQSQPAARKLARLGINLGTWTSWGAEQLSANVLMNPGFEATIDRAIVIVADTTEAGFTDDQTWLKRPDGFWRGAQFDVRSGAGAGRHGILTDSNGAGKGGMPFYATDAVPSDLKPGDVVALTLAERPPALADGITLAAPANWWIGTSSTARVGIDPGEHRPDSPGLSALSLKFGPARPAEVSSYLDAITPRAGKLLPVTGRWRIQFWSRAESDSKASIHVTFGRIGSAPFLDRTVDLTSAWSATSIDFAGHDGDVPPATLELKFSAAGDSDGRALLDDVDLRAVNSAAAPFRAEVIAALRVLHPGYLRDWQGQLADTLDNRIAPAFARRPTRYRPGDETQFSYSIPDFLDLCRSVDARPWMIVPATFSDLELVGLGKFLAAQNLAYRFDEIALEFGNENWNGIFRPAAIPNPETYGAVADRAFRLIREGSGTSLPLRMIVGGQYANPDLSARVAEHSPAADTLAVAPYFFYSMAASTPAAKRLDALFDDRGDKLQASAGAASRNRKTLAVYEVNLHTTAGDASASIRDPVIAGQAAGTALGRRIIQALDAGADIQCVYVLAGFDATTTPSGGFARLWGIARDLAAAPRFRPTGLATALINRALGGDFYRVATSDPDLSAAAFLNHSESRTQLQLQWSALIASASNRPLAVRIEFPAAANGRLPTKSIQLISKSPLSTNEEQTQVLLADAAIIRDGQAISLTLPPYGLAALVDGGLASAADPLITDYLGEKHL